MERNLYNRIEIMFPILDERCQKRIKQEIIKNYLKDSSHTWEMQSNGTYKVNNQGRHNAQETLIKLYQDEGMN